MLFVRLNLLLHSYTFMPDLETQQSHWYAMQSSFVFLSTAPGGKPD